MATTRVSYRKPSSQAAQQLLYKFKHSRRKKKTTRIKKGEGGIHTWEEREINKKNAAHRISSFTWWILLTYLQLPTAIYIYI